MERRWQRARTTYHLDLESPGGTDRWVLEHGGLVRDFRSHVYSTLRRAKLELARYAEYAQARGLDRRAVIRAEREPGQWVIHVGTFTL